MKLPVFRVASTIAAAERICDLGNRLFPRQDQQLVERGTMVELRSKLGAIEVDAGRGGLWAADLSRLWRFDPSSGKKPNLLAPADVERLGLKMLRAYAVLPDIAAPFQLKAPRVTGAKTVFAPSRRAPRQVVQEDTTVLVEIEVDVRDCGLKQKVLPIVGGGGRFSVVLGEAGRFLGMRGVWRPAVGKPTMHELIPQDKADEIYRAMTAGVPVVKFSSELAYYSAPAFSEQEILFPVYVYSAIADYQGNLVPLRKVMIPATEIGVIVSQPCAAAQRKRDVERVIRPLPADFQPAAGKALPPGIGVNRGLMRTKGLKFDDFFMPDPLGGALILKPDLTPVQCKELVPVLFFFSAGTSWIGLSGGLAGSAKNAQGFVDQLAAIGWNIGFNWGDAAAWESDWRRNDDNWVDAVDFVFYTGHANSDGWVLSAPDDTFLHFTETAGPRDLWGANNLEWAVIAACGPLQDEVVGSGGNVLDRWRDAFDGLHMLMGYAQVTYDNEEEGKRLAQYAKAGSTLMQSWFRTGQEIQPGGIWVGAYYLGDASGSTGNDHLWGVGSVGPDVTSPSFLACSWVPC